MQCPNCKSDNDSDANFCMSCGTQLTDNLVKPEVIPIKDEDDKPGNAYCQTCKDPLINGSKFCKSCGEPVPLMPNGSRRYSEFEERSSFYMDRSAIWIYLVWLVAVFLLRESIPDLIYKVEDSCYGRSPRGSVHVSFISVFIVFFLPLLIIAAFNFNHKDRYLKTPAFVQSYDLSFRTDFSALMLGFVMVGADLVYAAVSNTQRESPGDTSQGLLPGILFLLIILRFVVLYNVVQLSKKLNRDATTWGVFAFVSPTLALIILSQKNKLR